MATRSEAPNEREASTARRPEGDGRTGLHQECLLSGTAPSAVDSALITAGRTTRWNEHALSKRHLHEGTCVASFARGYLCLRKKAELG